MVVVRVRSLKKKLVQLFLIVYLATNLILSVSCPISDEWTISDEWIIADEWGEETSPPVGQTQGEWIVYASSLGFQQGYVRTGEHNYVLLTANTGMINSSTNRFLLNQNTGSGYFIFLSNETFTLQLDYDFTSVKLNGEGVTTGSTHSVNQGSTNTVSWNLITEPYIPYLFILGMIGLCCMFGGPLLAIKTMKENPRWAITLGATFTALGIGLFMAWLSS